jgi:hypothetical protein
MQSKQGGIIDKIMEKFQPDSKIEIQMDNASPHTGNNSVENMNTLLEERNIDGLYILQPPNSPDMNILDLAIFNSLQKNADKIKRGCTTVQQLVAAVYTAFDNYDPEKLRIAYAHLNACYNEVLKIEGDNQYKSPHKEARKKVNRNEPIDLVEINFVEYNRLKTIVADYFGEF